MADFDTDYLVSLFSRLVGCDSPSYGEDAVRDAVVSELAEIGITAAEDDAAGLIGGTCGNLYAYIEGDPSLPPVMFSCHLDTVEPSAGKKAVIHNDGRITSSGNTVLGADDVGGVASVLSAVRKAVRENVRHRPVELVFDVCEEKYCVGIQKFDFSKVRSNEIYVLDLDGRVGRAAIEAPSIIQWKAVFKGRSAHAGFSPEEGLHAVKAAADGISRVECGRKGDMTVNVGTVSGGTADNIVPSSCTVTGEIRGFDDAAVKAQSDEIRDQMISAAESRGLKCNFFCDLICRAFKTPENSSVCAGYVRACRKSGVTPEFIRTYGASTNNHWSNKGFSGIVISCAMNNCHSSEEWSSAEELKRSADIVYNIITDCDVTKN